MKRRKKSSDWEQAFDGLAAEESASHPQTPLEGFQRFYLIFIIGCALVAVLSIVLAVLVNVLGGIGVAIVLAVGYRIILADELKRRLSLSYRRVSDGLALSVKESGKEDFCLPSRLMWLDVTELVGESKHPSVSTVRLYLPRSIRRIDENAFSGMSSLTELIYEGSREEWQSVTVHADLTPYCLRFDNGCVHEEETV